MVVRFGYRSTAWEGGRSARTSQIPTIKQVGNACSTWRVISIDDNPRGRSRRGLSAATAAVGAYGPWCQVWTSFICHRPPFRQTYSWLMPVLQAAMTCGSARMGLVDNYARFHAGLWIGHCRLVLRLRLKLVTSCERLFRDCQLLVSANDAVVVPRPYLFRYTRVPGSTSCSNNLRALWRCTSSKISPRSTGGCRPGPSRRRSPALAARGRRTNFVSASSRRFAGRNPKRALHS